MFVYGNQDPREYFDSQQVNAVKTLDHSLAGIDQTRRNLSSEEAYVTFKMSISKIKTLGISDPLVTPEVASKVINLFVYYFVEKLSSGHLVLIFSHLLSRPSFKLYSHCNIIAFNGYRFLVN